MDFQTTDTFLTEDVFANRAENSQIVTTGGYYYKKLLIDPAPAIILWTQDNQIEAYQILNDQYNLIRSVPVTSVLKATLGQRTLTMKVEGQPLFNLLLDEAFRKKTLDGMKKNIVRDSAGIAVSNPGLDGALDVANIKTDLDYFKNAKKATTMDWAELFKAHQVQNL